MKNQIASTRRWHGKTGGSFRQAHGFTLPETMMSVLIMGFLFLSFYAVVDTGVAVTRRARENLRATQILLNHMEGIRLFRWDQLSDRSLLPTNFTTVFNPLGTNGDQGITYTGAVTVASAQLNPAANYSTNLYLITVQLTWTSGNVVRTRQMSTYAARYGEQNYVIGN